MRMHSSQSSSSPPSEPSSSLPSPSTSALTISLTSALQSRQSRNILRSLPSPTTSTSLVDFTSNDYLSLSTSPLLRSFYLRSLSSTPNILGSAGSRLLINPSTHVSLEEKLRVWFGVQKTLLFNSGYDANVSLFSVVPQPGDAVVMDEAVHASVWDGVRASRLPHTSIRTFKHNSPSSLLSTLISLTSASPALLQGRASVFIALESLYSMDGTIAPLPQLFDVVEKVFPRQNAYIVVDEAHATGIYGPGGRGLVAHFGLEDRVWVRLVTFGKALAGSGAILLLPPLLHSFLLNYARPLIYTTTLSHASALGINCVFDLLDGRGHGKDISYGEELSTSLLSLSTYFLGLLRLALVENGVPEGLVRVPFVGNEGWEETELEAQNASAPTSTSPAMLHALLPTPILPLLTPHPHSLANHLRAWGGCGGGEGCIAHACSNGLTPTSTIITAAPQLSSSTTQPLLRSPPHPSQIQGLNLRPITHPTVPYGAERVRVCLHAGNTEEEVGVLVCGVVRWAEEAMKAESNSKAKL